MLEFGNLNDIEKVYNGKQNLIRRKKTTSPNKKKYDFDDIKKFLLSKKYIKIENGQTLYILENLVVESKYKGFDGKPVFINISIKDIDKMYKDNFRLLDKYKKLEVKKINCQAKIQSIYKEKFKYKIQELNYQIEKIDKKLKKLKPKIFFY